MLSIYVCIYNYKTSEPGVLSREDWSEGVISGERSFNSTIIIHGTVWTVFTLCVVVVNVKGQVYSSLCITAYSYIIVLCNTVDWFPEC